MILFLDDNEDRIREFEKRSHELEYSYVIAKNAYDAIISFDEFDFDCIFLDHDLGEDMDTNNGMAVVEWILKYNPKIRKIIIHSWNTPASQRMFDALKGKYNTKRIPFSVSFLDYLDVWIK